MTSAGRERALLLIEGMRKVFPNGTVALDGVDLAVGPSSVHGLVGANGAGKSTLIKILAGAITATSGRLVWKGQEQEWSAPGDASASGVATIYQHIPLVPTLSVLENVFMPRAGWRRRPPRLEDDLEALLARVGYRIDPDSLVSELSIGQRQMVAILQALATGAELIVMDEPTASLAQAEREIVFDVVRRLSLDGTAFIYVSHFLDEVLELTDHVTVLRDGRVVKDASTAALDESALVHAIVGRQLLAVEQRLGTPTRTSEAPLLEVAGLSSPAGIRDVALAVRPGEVVGLAGLLGSGRSETLHAIFGADPAATGEVRVAGQALGRGPHAAVRAGVALVPEDRARQGLVGGDELWRNISLPDLPRLARYGALPVREREMERAAAAIEQLGIRAPGPDTLVAELSGGNAQKVVFGKWLFADRRVFLLDEPTAGIDVGAKADILELIRGFAAEGKAVLLVSSEFEELLAVCTRLHIMRRGRLVAERLVTETSEQELLELASGLRQEEEQHAI
jgi:ribose transport system ATP-binding protein